MKFHELRSGRAFLDFGVGKIVGPKPHDLGGSGGGRGGHLDQKGRSAHRMSCHTSPACSPKECLGKCLVQRKGRVASGKPRMDWARVLTHPVALEQKARTGLIDRRDDERWCVRRKRPVQFQPAASTHGTGCQRMALNGKRRQASGGGDQAGWIVSGCSQRVRQFQSQLLSVAKDVVHHQSAVDDVKQAPGEIAGLVKCQREDKGIQQGGLAATRWHMNRLGPLSGAECLGQSALPREWLLSVQRTEERWEVAGLHADPSVRGNIRPRP